MTPRRYQNAPKAPAKRHQYGPNKAQKGPQEDSKSDLKMSLAMTLHDSETPKMTPNCSKLIPEIHPKWSKPNSVDSKNAPRNALLSFIAHPAHHVFCHFRVNFVVILWSSSDRSWVSLGTFDITLGSFRGHFVVILGSFCDHVRVILGAFGTIS